jgi:hypothetical protein
LITVHLQIDLSTHLKTIVANRRLYISDKILKLMASENATAVAKNR